ncbi:MAG: sigma-70 family RNA polymerase sigma factor [Candidatus Goldiibacteriota bacterium]|jgi:RNA polymerase sigma-70 factor (ECF subfamily)
MDDSEIIEKVKKGEVKYFAEIIAKYKKVVFGHAYNFLRSREEAEDASQEIFVSVYNNLKNFRGDSKLSTWIYRITVNMCKNRLKQLQRFRGKMTEEFYEEGAEEKPSLVDGIKEKEEKEPDKSYASDEVRKTVYKRIDELTEEQRTVIMMRDVDGLSYEEIGQVLKISVSAVKSKLFRARENLREKLQKDDIL